MFYYKEMAQSRAKDWNRHYVEVIAIHRYDGGLAPLCILWEDGRAFRVSSTGDPQRTYCRNTGGCALRYAIVVSGRKRELYLDDYGHWFVEVKGDGNAKRLASHDPRQFWPPE